MKRLGGRVVALLLVAAAVGHAAPCSADASASSENEPVPHRVRLDVTPNDSPVLPLLRAELGELGLDVVESAAGEPMLTVYVILESNSLEVRVVNEATGRVSGREVFSVADRRKMDARTAALHAVEFLRWHLRPDSAPRRIEAPNAEELEPESPRPVLPKAQSNADLRIGLLPIAMYSPGGTRPGFGGQLDLLRRWGSIGARVIGASSFVSSRLTLSEGNIDVNASFAGLEGVVLLGSAHSGTALELGAGLAVFGAGLSGTSNAANQGLTDSLLTLAPLGDVRVRHQLASGVSLALGSTCLLPLQSSRLLALDREVGRYGQVVVTLGLGVELTLL